jgi:hypothetical protein
MNQTAIPWSNIADLIGLWKVNHIGGRYLIIKGLTIIDSCTTLGKIG